MRTTWNCLLLVGLGWAVSFVLSACIEVPAAPAHDDGFLNDAGLELGSALDGGARRPPTGMPYTGPQCDEAEPPSVTIAGDGGQLFDPEPRAGDEELAGTAGSGGSMAVAGSGSDALAARRAGQLVVSELMSNPGALRDDDGEWVELYNPSSDASVALDGCALDDGAAMRAVMDGLRVPPLGFVVFARSAQVGFAPTQLLSLSLANSADSVALICAGTVIDRVSYGAGFPLVAGASMSLDPTALDSVANDAESAWCAGRTPDAIGELGTPGAANPACSGEDDAGTP